MSDRIDPDYAPSDREIENFAKLFALLGQRVGSVRFVNGNGNGFAKWMLALCMLLFVAGVTAVATVEYSVAQRLSVLETKVEILLVRK